MKALSKKREWLLAGVCLALFLILVLLSIGRSSIWHDESYSIFLIRESYVDIIRNTALDVHPPLYYLVLKAWASLFGEGLIALRAFSMVTMLGAIVIAWRIFRRSFGINKGLLALFAMSMGPFLVRYGQEMRMYGLAAFLTACATYIWLKIMAKNKRDLKLYLMYGLLIAAGFYTQYFFVLVPASHIVHVLIVARGSLWRHLKQAAQKGAGLIFTALLILPWLPTVKDQFSEVHGSFWIPPVSTETLTSTPIAMTILKKQFELRNWEGLLAVVVLGFVTFVLYRFIRQAKPKEGDATPPLVTLYTFLPMLLLFVLSLPPLQPAYQDRYQSFFAAFFYGALALGAYSLVRHGRKLAVGAVGLLFLFFSYGQVNNYRYGNNHGWNQPTFTINELHEFIDSAPNNDPVYSTSLWTYFDAEVTITNHEVWLLGELPTRWYGNFSAMIGNKDQFKPSIDAGTNSFWLIDEAGASKAPAGALDGYRAGDSLKLGYAIAQHYTKVN